MKRAITSVILSLVSYGCLANAAMIMMGQPPFLPIPPQFNIIVIAVASFTAFSLATSALSVLGRIGLVLSSIPMFGVAGVLGFAAGGPIGGLVGFLVPLAITLKWGIWGLLGMGLLAIAGAFLVL